MTIRVVRVTINSTAFWPIQVVSHGQYGLIAVVTGGNKGIGFEICKLLASSSDDVLVVLTARDEQKGLQALHKLKTSGLKTYMTKQVMLQTYETAKDCIQTNYYGTKHVTEALLPFLSLSSSPRIVNISSGVGKLENVKDKRSSQMLSDVNRLTEEVVEEVVTGFLCDVKDDSLEEKGWNAPLSAYIVSKAVINAYTRILANKYLSFRINAINPGFTKIDMTHHKGTYTVEEGARGPVWLALLPDEGPSGRFFFQMEETTF
ncbi:hypothetical protein L1987_81216 [Smallanthus sonchifolius]|uniref:Uncharacterized protein n=1 Tax=Smallanthus sonchifolius TaxID=185202 RepID=A0ACB8YRF7_9ASTR|nr:hypothetical protein L1987_81216 [Smallanthus sonchifolius]